MLQFLNKLDTPKKLLCRKIFLETTDKPTHLKVPKLQCSARSKGAHWLDGQTADYWTLNPTWLINLLEPYTKGGVHESVIDVAEDWVNRRLAGASVPAVLATMFTLGNHWDSSCGTNTSRGIALSFLCLCLSGRRSKYSSVTAMTRTK